MVSNDDIGRLVRDSPDAQSLTRVLVDAANEAGGIDNIGVAVFLAR
jgi:serine/threonine protein phosphatase PrpC